MYKRLIFLISVALVLCAADYTSAAVDAEIPFGSPTIDGDKGDSWSGSDEHSVENLVVGQAPVNGADLSASWWGLWDTENLYIFVDVNDSDLRNDDSGESWHDDSVGIMFDINDDDLTAYGEDDYEFRFAWNADPNVKDSEEHWHGERSLIGVEFIVLTKNFGSGDGGRGDGYVIEIKFPWETLDYLNTGATVLGDMLGVDVSINDQDGPGDRDTQICWYDTTGQAWHDPSLFGTMELGTGPVIELSAEEFVFYSPEGGPNPDDQILGISNSGAGTLNWEITYDCNWLTVDPVSGSSTGEPNEVTLSVDVTGLAEGIYDCNLTISAPNVVNSPQTVVVTLRIECFPFNHPDYDEWVKVGRPDCWCYPRQCHGDSDNMHEGGTKTGYFYVHFNDLAQLQSGWNIKEPPKGPGIRWPDPNICADFAHDEEGNTKTGYYRVHFNDLAILCTYWNVKEKPGEPPAIPLDCLDVPPVEPPGIEYEISPCDMGLSVTEQSDQTRFTVTVEGRYIHFEDMMVANCCPDRLELQMVMQDNLIVINEIEHLTMPCTCICDYPVTATLGPFNPGTYTIEVYEDWGGFIGSTTFIIE